MGPGFAISRLGIILEETKVHFQDLVIVLGFNLVVILFFFMVQKRAIAKHIKHLKSEIQELEDLVAAIIEEFEEIANPENEIETGIGETGEQTVRARARGDVEPNLETDFETDWIENAGVDHYDGGLRKAPFMPEESLHLEAAAAGEESELFDHAGASEEEVNSSAREYSPGNEFGLFKTAPNQPRKTSGKESGANGELINDPKHRRILDLWKQGLSIEEIARQLSIGRGEIQLILGIYRRG